MSDDRTGPISEFKKELEDLPGAPKTTLQIIDSKQNENDWQKLLFYYLSPHLLDPHGLDRTLLNHILSALSDRDDLDFTFSQSNLDKVEIAQEKKMTNDKIPDAVMWIEDEWLMIWELKTKSPEDKEQTQNYVNARGFSSINLNKENIPSDKHYYIYLAPEHYPPPEADEFVPVSWKWIANKLRLFLLNDDREYPSETKVQLNMFTETLRSELKMGNYKKIHGAKEKLYLDYHNQISEIKNYYEDEIMEIKNLFNERWRNFINKEEWVPRLVDSIETAEYVIEPDAPRKYFPTEITMENGDSSIWAFWQDDRWAAIHPTDWWIDPDTGRKIYEKKSGDCVRLSYVHKFRSDGKKKAKNGKLKFLLRSPDGASDKFQNEFNLRFRQDSNIQDLIESLESSIIDKSTANMLKAEYDIKTELHSGFFEAYIAALTKAIEEHVVQNPELMKRIDKIHDRTIKYV
jgi:hypothetical protein